MRQAYRIIPIYTADVSGVCSALYELGGMTVMHDPSGCNSTYNTHDEIRWYDQDSLIFISGLTDIDAIMGNDEKFLQDIEEAAKELKPKFIALASSPIPFMNGTDFPGLARALTARIGIPVSVSITLAIAGKSVPFIKGIGEPASAINFGCSSLAACSISSINFRSFPMIASISVRPEIKIRLS